jgi:hypothetical protein
MTALRMRLVIALRFDPTCCNIPRLLSLPSALMSLPSDIVASCSTHWASSCQSHSSIGVAVHMAQSESEEERLS